MRKWTDIFLYILTPIIIGCGPDRTTPPDNAESPELLDIDIEAGNVETTAIVSWETEGDSFEFYVEHTDEIVDTVYQWDKYPPLTNNSPTSAQEVLIPFVQGTDHYIRVLAKNEGGDIEYESLPFPFQSGYLDVPVDIEFTFHDPDRAQPGWRLANLYKATKTTSMLPAVFDEEGRLRWYFDPYPKENEEDEDTGLMSYEVTWKDDLRLFFYMGSIPTGKQPVAVDLAGRTVWQADFIQPQFMDDHGAMHHMGHWDEDKPDTIIGLAVDGTECLEGDDPYDCATDVIFEVEVTDPNLISPPPAGQVVQDVASYVLNMGPFVHDDDYRAFNNAVDYADGRYYYYHRMGDALIMVHENGDFGWTAGGANSEFTLLDGEWPFRAHGMKLVEDNRFLFFDNGGPTQEGALDSRIVMIQLDEDSYTSEIIWEFPDPGSVSETEEMSSLAGGDADLLANGNILAATGSSVSGYPFLIFEVTPDHQKVWEVEISGENFGGIYAVQMIPNLLEDSATE